MAPEATTLRDAEEVSNGRILHDSRSSANRCISGAPDAGKQEKQQDSSICYYIDELGFYRWIEGQQAKSASSGYRGNLVSKNATHSLFDRSDAMAKDWRAKWDEFMRLKLTKQEPVLLNNELKTLIRSGIPHDYRCKVWTALIRMRTRSLRLQTGDDIYHAIVDHWQLADDQQSAKQDSESPQPQNTATSSLQSGSGTRCQDDPLAAKPQLNVTKCFRQIELDLLRTLPNNRHFEEPNSRGVQRVRRVLRAYACFNDTVGYCQGMNRLAAMALLVLPEEEAFWCLVAIIQCIMPRDYYLRPWLAQVDCCVLADLLAKKLPKLHRHLVRNDIQLSLFSWFFTIFVDGFLPELMLRIWDCFLLEGDKVLFRFALAILSMAQEDLIRMHDFSAMSLHLSRLVSTRRLDVELLFKTFEDMNPLSSRTLESRRQFHMKKMKSVIEE